MNYGTLISKISERGQITLPKRLRETRVFQDAQAVEFEERADALVIRPIKHAAPSNEHRALLDYTMGDWSLEAHDDLFDFNQQKK